MKLIIHQSYSCGNYFLALMNENKSLISDRDSIIAEILNLTPEEYVNILEQYNAYENFGYFFKSKQDAKNAIMTLEPYIIMATLTK